jgi:hypothetical protein
MPVKKAVFDQLVATPIVIKSLATYDFGDGVTRPAIFTLLKPPDDADDPCINIVQEGGQPIHYKGEHGADVAISVTLHGGNVLTGKGLMRVAIRIWQALDQADLTVEGFTVADVSADFPREIEGDYGLTEYVIDMTIKIIDEE